MKSQFTIVINFQKKKKKKTRIKNVKNLFLDYPKTKLNF